MVPLKGPSPFFFFGGILAERTISWQRMGFNAQSPVRAGSKPDQIPYFIRSQFLIRCLMIWNSPASLSSRNS